MQVSDFLFLGGELLPERFRRRPSAPARPPSRELLLEFSHLLLLGSELLPDLGQLLFLGSHLLLRRVVVLLRDTASAAHDHNHGQDCQQRYYPETCCLLHVSLRLSSK